MPTSHTQPSPATPPAHAPLPTAEDARREVSKPRLGRDVRYALLRQPEMVLARPQVFPDLASLAKAILRDRKGAPIQLLDAQLALYGEKKPRDGVSVWTLGEGGDRHRYLGWVWLAGGGRQALQAAIFAEHPSLVGEG